MKKATPPRIRWSEPDGWVNVDDELIERLEVEYPKVVIEHRLEDMDRWLRDNPDKALKIGDWDGFARRWLAREVARMNDPKQSFSDPVLSDSAEAKLADSWRRLDVWIGAKVGEKRRAWRAVWHCKPGHIRHMMNETAKVGDGNMRPLEAMLDLMSTHDNLGYLLRSRLPDDLEQDPNPRAVAS